MTTLSFKNFVFDCDSTLVSIEGLDSLSCSEEISMKIRKITESGMTGETPFKDSLQERLSLIKPNKEDLELLGEKYIESKLPGVKTLFGIIGSLGGEVYIASGGLKEAIDIFADYAGVKRENVYGVDLEFDKSGSFKRIAKGSILAEDFGKELVLKEISVSGPTVFVGDGMTDVRAGQVCDMFIGFGGVKEREVVRKTCRYYYKSINLLGLLEYFCNIYVNAER